MEAIGDSCCTISIVGAAKRNASETLNPTEGWGVTFGSFNISHSGFGRSGNKTMLQSNIRFRFFPSFTTFGLALFTSKRKIRRLIVRIDKILVGVLWLFINHRTWPLDD